MALTDEVEKQANEQIIHFWRQVSEYYHLTEEFIDKHRLWLDWKIISLFQPLSIEQIRKYIGYLDFVFLSSNKKIQWTEETINEFKDRLCMSRIAFRTDLPDIAEMARKETIEADLETIRVNYDLPTNFRIEKFDWKRCEITYNCKVYKSKTGTLL